MIMNTLHKLLTSSNKIYILCDFIPWFPPSSGLSEDVLKKDWALGG